MKRRELRIRKRNRKAAHKKQKMKVKRQRRSPLIAKRIKTAMMRQLNSKMKIKKLRIRLKRPIKLPKTKMESQVLRSKTFSLLST